jgi:hypothetical protein
MMPLKRRDEAQQFEARRPNPPHLRLNKDWICISSIAIPYFHLGPAPTVFGAR